MNMAQPSCIDYDRVADLYDDYARRLLALETPPPMRFN